MDVIEQMNWRYAVKKFDSEKILHDEKVERLKEAFNLTATSYGLQPVTLLVIQNKELQSTLVPHSYEQQQVAQASHVLVICIQRKVDEDYIAKYFEQVGKVRGTSDAILDPFKEALIDNFSEKEEDEIKHWATNQGYLAMGNLLTVCALEKIDSCPMEGFEPEAYDNILKLEERGLTSILVLPVGYRAEDDMFSGFKKVRKNMSESVIEIK
ncbi:NAD(P)H-dependent oxidoreductase [Maribacter halichondriae]|uniref:NAD(P)H-dependent oxidoreductase n=1 Tax=Maribacter halichondriae TaxID=2980554 RepID=UPI0023593763|nr:NAD(P)H-dependent oxidoreductase [Maribacter sp. Hal144]